MSCCKIKNCCFKYRISSGFKALKVYFATGLLFEEKIVAKLTMLINLFKKNSLILIALFLIINITLRFYNIDADPSYISWSKGVIFDPAIYSLNLKNFILTGSPFVYENNYFLLFPFHYFLQKIYFYFINYNYTNLNLFAVILNILTTIIIFFICKKIFNIKYGIAALFFISFSYVNIAYSRISYVEITMVFMAVLGLLFYFQSNNWFKFFSGIIFFLSIITKLNSIVIFAAVILFELYEIICAKKKIINLCLILCGFLIGFLIFIMVYFYPNIFSYKQLYYSKIYTDVIKTHSPANILTQLFKIKIFFNTNIFYKMPIIAFLSILFFAGNLFNRNNYGIFFFIWIISGIFFTNMSEYSPFRYRLIIMPAIYITAAIAIVEFDSIILKFYSLNFLIAFSAAAYYIFLILQKFSRIYLLIIFIIFVFIIIRTQKFIFTKKIRTIILIIFLIYNIAYYLKCEIGKERLIKKFNEIVYQELIQQNDYRISAVAGYGSPVFCMNTPVKVINYKNCPDDLISKFRIKYLIVREDEFNTMNRMINFKILHKEYFKTYNENIYFLRIENNAD